MFAVHMMTGAEIRDTSHTDMPWSSTDALPFYLKNQIA